MHVTSINLFCHVQNEAYVQTALKGWWLRFIITESVSNMLKRWTTVYKITCRSIVSVLHGEQHISTLFWLCGGNDSCVVVSISVRQERGGVGGLRRSLTWPRLGWVTPVRQSVFGSFQHSRSVSYSSHSGLSALVWSSISWY